MGGRDGMYLWLRVGKRQGIFFEAESVLSEVVVFGQRRAWARGCAVVAKSWVVVVETGREPGLGLRWRRCRVCVMSLVWRDSRLNVWIVRERDYLSGCVCCCVAGFAERRLSCPADIWR